MSLVGIIANPVSGSDIRRLVAQASMFGMTDKVNIIRRTLLAMDAVGVERAVIMPDGQGLGYRALDGLNLSRLRPEIMDMPVTWTDRDSSRAASMFCHLGASCAVVLGGDGTNRVVAKGCGTVPIVSISTGTNNVFPAMVEGTVAGMAAGLVATGAVDVSEVTYRAKRLEVYLDGEFADIALIDVATSTDQWVGSRAIWDPTRLREIVLARAEPGSIGISSVGSCIRPLSARDDIGLHIVMGPGGKQFLAPMAPGLVTRVPVREHQLLSNGDEVVLHSEAGTVALDGEREIELYGHRKVSVRLTRNGPLVVDIPACMIAAARSGYFCRQD